MSGARAASRRHFLGGMAALAGVAASGPAGAAPDRVTAFMQALAEAVAGDPALAAFYRDNGHRPIWTGRGGRDRARRQALLGALEDAPVHALPQAAYDDALLRANLGTIRSGRDLGRAEAALSRLFLTYVNHLQGGVLEPRRVDREIIRSRPLRAGAALLESFSRSSPAAFLRRQAPRAPEYARLMKAKREMERLIGRGGWGPEVPGGKLRPGDSGARVVALRDRLVAMGYMRRSASREFDAPLMRAVRAFQLAHGLNPDGVVGPGTLRALNVSAERRLAAIIVAMERERWMNIERGKRHVWVNLAAFSVAVIDEGKVTFETRAVVGANRNDRRSPEFSDMMEYMVVNPTWNVPRSIAVKEYLPLLQKDPNAAGHLRLTRGGQPISREGIDFTQFTEADFPFDLKQPPSRRNALGLVKFMFPNRYNIYLHDTPEKHLFARERRAYSHGCIRLNDPFEFAYTLLAPQVSDPEAFFQARLASGRETVVPLERHVPVHLVYRTAFTTARGQVRFRDDIYGRDGRIFEALRAAGVALRAVRG